MKIKSGWVLLGLVAVTLVAGCSTTPDQPLGLDAPQAMLGAPPPEAQKWWQQAEKEQKAGNTAAALALWDRIAQTYPNSTMAPGALHRSGVAYLDQGQPDRALLYLDYLLFHYPTWEEINLGRLDRLRALAIMGRTKEVTREATPLWETSAAQPAVQVGLSRLMTQLYGSTGDVENGFQWASSGFSVARTPEEQKTLAAATLELLKNIDENALRKLHKKDPSDFMKVFLEFQLSQIELQKGEPAEIVGQRLRAILVQYPNHPLVPQLQAALRGTPGGAPALPLHAERIGALVPINGSYAKYGEMVLRGLKLANANWNESHPDQNVTLVVQDAQTEPEQALSSFEELVKSEGALAVVGPLGAQASKAVAPVADKWNVPLLTLTQREDDKGEYSFVLHVFLDNRQLVRTLVRHCRERLGYSRFAVLYPEDRYGQKLSKIFAEVVQELGGTMMASVSYKDKSTDFKDSIQKLMTIAKKNAPPSGTEVTPFEALFLPDQVQTVSLIAPQLPYNNVVGVTLLGTNLWAEAPLVQAGGVYVEQAIFATPFYAESRSPRIQSFQERYQAMYNEPPSYLEAQAYDALMLLLHARSTLPAQGMDRGALMQNLLKIRQFEGVTGTYSFSPTGEMERNYQLLQVVNGQLVPVGF